MSTLMAVNDPVTIGSLILALTCGFLVVNPSNRREAHHSAAREGSPQAERSGKEVSEGIAQAGLSAFERRLRRLAAERDVPNVLTGRAGLFREAR